MFRSLAVLALAFGASSALACPPTEMKIKDLTFNSDGVITRSIMVKSEAKGQKAKRGMPTYVPAVRDTIRLEVGDRLILNADPLVVDAHFEVEATLAEKDFDDHGTLSSTFNVRETAYFTFGSIKYRSAEKTYKAKITSDYVGGGKFSKTCGAVLVSDLVVVDPEKADVELPVEPEAGERR